MDLHIIDDARAVTPGERVELRLQIRNDGGRRQRAAVRVVGSGSMIVDVPPSTELLEPGAEATVPIVVLVPTGQTAGNHRLGVEVTGEDGSKTTGQATLSVTSAAKVALSLSPNTIHGRRGGRFRVDLTNRGDHPVDLELTGEGDGLELSVTPNTVSLPPGDRVRLRGRVRRTVAKQAVSNADRLFTIVAQGNSTPVRATAVFAPRAFVPLGARKVGAIALAMIVWAVGLLAGLQYMEEQDLAAVRAEAQAEADEIAAADAAAAEAEEAERAASGDAGTEDDAAADALAFADDGSVDIGGVVDLGSGDDHSGVAVTLRPVTLGSSSETLAASAAASPGVGKVSALHAGPRPRIGLLDVQSTNSNEEGTWGFANVEAPGQYEIQFAKAGYITQSHLVAVDEGDDPVELPVTMDAGDGRLGGRVSASGTAVGGATVTITDGVVTYTTSTATTGDVGRWSVVGLETPGRYLVTVSRRGYGTETQALDLSAGGAAEAISTSLTAGVGSISGTVRFLGDPIGAINITATDGNVTRQTSSLTETDVGSFLLPQLPSPGTYTLTVSGAGYITQTLDVATDGNTDDVVIQLVSSTAIVAGTVVDIDGTPVSGVGITASDGTHTFKTTSAIDPPGSYELTGMPPGSYVVGFDRFEYQPASSLVTVAAGDVKTLDKTLVSVASPQVVSEASVSISPEDAGQLVAGATIKLQGAQTFTTSTVGPDNRYELTGLPVGTYVLTISHPSYQTVIQTVRLGPRTVIERTVALQALGDLFGVVTDTDGVAVAGATVIVSFATVDANGNPTTSSLAPLFTNLSGEYGTEKSLGSREYTVEFSAPGYQTMSRTFIGQTGTSSELNVDLFSQPEIVGVVRYRNDSGTPVALSGETGITVEYRRTGSTDPFASVPVSSTDGSFAIPNTSLTVGSWQLQLDGLPARFAVPVTMPSTSNLALNEVRSADIMVPVNPSLQGTVRALDPDGVLRPLGPVTVQAQKEISPGSWTDVGPAVVTGADGVYAIGSAVLSAGNWRLQMTAAPNGHIATTSTEFALQLDTRPVRDLQVAANPQVAITVKDKNQNPLPGITVAYDRIDPGTGSVIAGQGGTVLTDGSGVARITKTDLTPGRYTFTVQGSAGLQDELVFANQDVIADQILPLNAVLFPDPTVDGFVRRLNSSNQFVGVVGAAVEIRPAGGGTAIATVTSGPGGFFSFDPDTLDPGDYEVVLLPGDARIVTVAGLANNESRSVELIVPQSSTVSGTLFWLDAAGQRHDLEPTAPWTVSAANVIVDHTASTPAVIDVLGNLSDTGTGPGWSLSGQAAGSSDYQITVTDGRFDPVVVPNVVVAPGTDPAAIDVELTPLDAAISGAASADGAPLAGATVTLTSGAATRTTTTIGDGSWSITDLVPGTWSIVVTRNGFQPATQPGPVTVAPNASAVAATATLNELRTVTINVNSNGAPLVGATVTLTGAGGPFTQTEPVTGQHVFTGVPQGSYNVTVAKVGFAVTDGAGAVVTVPDVTVAWGADPTPVAVELSQYGIITGVFEGTTAGETTPLVGYTVTATIQGGSGSTVTAVTQSNGGFTLPDLVQGTWDITISASGFVAPTITPVPVVWNGGTSDIGTTTLIAETGSISLVPHSDNFEPDPGPLGDVTVELTQTGTSTVVATMVSSTSDPATGVVFPDVDAGDWTLTLTASGHGPKTIQYVLSRGEDAVIASADTVMEGNSGGIVGTVQWRRAGSGPLAPLVGTTIVVTRRGNQVARLDGAPSPYSISLLANRTHTVTASKPGFQTASQDIRIRNGSIETANFVLVADPVPVTVSVVDDLGDPIDGVALQLAGFQTYADTTTSLGAGSFPTVEPDINDYTLTAVLDGYEPRSVPVTVAPGLGLAVPEITMNRLGTAELRVEDDLGAVVNDAVVALTGDPAHVATFDSGTDTYTFDNLPVGGPLGITITRNDHDDATTTTATVTAGSSQTLADVVLNRSRGDLIVEVDDPDGTAVTGATVEVRDNGGTLVGSADLSTPTPSSSTTFTGLLTSAGPYSVQVTKDYMTTFSTPVAGVAVDAATPVTVEAELSHRPSLAVTVTADPSGPADPEVTVTLRNASDGTFTGTPSQTGPAGTFTFANLDPGDYDGYRVVFTGSGYHPVNQVVAPLTIDQGLVSDSTVGLVALGTIVVTVNDDSDNPVNGATVTLSGGSLGGPITPTSTSGNVYTFSGLAAATDYALSVSKTPGYDPPASSPPDQTIVAADSTPVTVTVVLPVVP